MNARFYVTSLIGRDLTTLSGRSNRILRLEGHNAVVATEKSPNGAPVPIAWVQNGLDLFERDGAVRVHKNVLGYRSAFIGSVLRTLPNAEVSLRPARVWRRG